MLSALDDSQAVTQSRYYYAIENLDTAQVVRRGITTTKGIPQNGLILAPETRYREWLFQVEGGMIGFTDLTTPANGQRFTIPTIKLGLPLTPDSDGDGLSDDAEFVIGTDPAKADTDGDGIPDGAEAAQGLDPLDGLAVRTGIVGSTDTPGTAVDVCAFNDIVVVANSSAGISVFNVFNRMVPLVIAQVPLPGNARAVSCSGNLIGVANDSQGLAVVDITDPPNARISQQVNLGGIAVAVATAGGIAYLGLVSGQIISVDMSSGTILERINSGAAIHDLAILGDLLFVVLPAQLRAYSLSDEGLALSGTVNTSGLIAEGLTGRKRLFVGGGNAYVTSYPGYDVVDIRNPAAMQLVGLARDLGPNSFKQIVLNGSGLGIAAVGANPRDDGTHDISLYDISNPTITTAFQTTLTTPGMALALSLYNGLAYVADGNSGLQVMNYLSYDTKGIAPTIALSANFSMTSATNGTAEEGKGIRVTANVNDDVQVRNVEFYLDGRKFATDGNYPFEVRLITPLLSRQRSFKLQARASDTGGNFKWSEEIAVALVPDGTPPRVTRTFPPPGGIVGSVDTLAAYFSEPIAQATLNSSTFQITSAGNDGILGNADDVLMKGGTVSYRDELNGGFLNFGTNLPPGMYQGLIRRPVADLAGNLIARDVAWNFWVLGQQDSDGDGIPDSVEAAFGYDPHDPDSNHNGILDGDEDPDGDGLKNRWELFFGYNPLASDSDGNGVPDGSEDPDLDGLTNLQEQAYGTNPKNADTDGDGFDDASEVADGTSPLDPHSAPRVLSQISSLRIGYLNALPEQLPGSLPLLISSSPLSYLNALSETTPDQATLSVVSPTVGYLNALPEMVPIEVTLPVTSPVISYLNAGRDELPLSVSFIVSSRLVSYLNALGETGNTNQFISSPVISYENQAAQQVKNNLFR